MSTSLFSKTPSVAVLDNRGLTVRDIAYHCHPSSPDVIRERITRHRYNARGFLTQSADPRLHDAGRVNFSYLTNLAGGVLRTQGTDNGTTISLNDAAGRPFIAVSNISTADDGTQDRSQAVTRTWQYENATLSGRPLSITELVNGEPARITERFVYAGSSVEEKALNLAGQPVSHYDATGLTQTDSIALTGVSLSVTRRLLRDADNPNAVADWQGEDASVWNDQLDAGTYTTQTTADATGAVLTTTDAKGNLQRVVYNVAGLLSGSWLTLKDGKEQAIVKSLTYSAAGQKLREEHGNGVVTVYTYEAETQRLIGIKTERPASHTSGAKVLQDLRYEYDPVGNVLKISNDAEETRFWRNQKVVPENVYVYDSLYQLVRASGREMANAGQQGSGLLSAIVPFPADGSAYTNYTRTYTYDEGGNLTRIRHSAPATGNSYTTNITISDRSNRGVLSTLEENPSDVDALFTAGGQQTQLLPGQALYWTLRNELLQVAPVVRESDAADWESYRYDAGSLRILKVSGQKTGNSTQTQRALYLPGLELRTKKAGDTQTESLQVITAGEAGQAQVRVLHWESGVPEGIDNDQVRYNYDSLIGSSSLELDDDGNIISMEEYYPYGGTAVWAVRSAVEANYKTVRYSGKELDATGLYYYGYRYYQPWAGRWLSSDPAGTVDGLNVFRMVRNNPVTLGDMDGLAPYSPSENSVKDESTNDALALVRTSVPRHVSNHNMISNVISHTMRSLIRENVTHTIPARVNSSITNINSTVGILAGFGESGEHSVLKNISSTLGVVLHSAESMFVHNVNSRIGLQHMSQFSNKGATPVSLENTNIGEMNLVIRKKALGQLMTSGRGHNEAGEQTDGGVKTTGGSIQQLNVIMDEGVSNIHLKGTKIGRVNMLMESGDGQYLRMSYAPQSVSGMEIENVGTRSLRRSLMQVPQLSVNTSRGKIHLDNVEMSLSRQGLKFSHLRVSSKIGDIMITGGVMTSKCSGTVNLATTKYRS